MRKFNIAGPIVAAKHYYIPPLRRSGFEEVLQLVEDANYFIVYAPVSGIEASLRPEGRCREQPADSAAAGSFTGP